LRKGSNVKMQMLQFASMMMVIQTLFVKTIDYQKSTMKELH
jgi:hypothetical protein